MRGRRRAVVRAGAPWLGLLLLAVTVSRAGGPSDCLPCHQTVVDAWSTSRHAVAATNPTFQASWRHWPNGWCLGCHAPSPESQRAGIGTTAVAGAFHAPLEAPGPAWGWGVDCAVCHGTLAEGVRTGGEPSPAALAAHDVIVDPEVGSEALCARCHQFPFQQHTPATPFAYGTTPAQDTVAEWARSVAAAEGRGCRSCHGGAAGHAFVGAHDPDLVRDALRFEVVRDGEQVRVTVRAPDAAHRIPTGDPFRRIEILACSGPACARIEDRALMARSFRPDAASWTLHADTTLPPTTPDAPSVRTFRLDAPTSTWWRAVYRYGDRQFESDLPPDEVGFVIADGPIGG